LVHLDTIVDAQVAQVFIDPAIWVLEKKP